jgi:hypothetical protein
MKKGASLALAAVSYVLVAAYACAADRGNADSIFVNSSNSATCCNVSEASRTFAIDSHTCEAVHFAIIGGDVATVREISALATCDRTTGPARPSVEAGED